MREKKKKPEVLKEFADIIFDFQQTLQQFVSNHAGSVFWL